MVDPKRLPSPDDLLILLTVARLGRFNAVAESLGTTHTTISRRILALDRQLGGRTLERTPQAVGRPEAREARDLLDSAGTRPQGAWTSP